MSAKIHERQHQIMHDKDYRMQLILTLAEKNPEVIEKLIDTNFGLYAAINKLAFEMAVSEAMAAEYLKAVVPNTVHSLTIRGRA